MELKTTKPTKKSMSLRIFHWKAITKMKISPLLETCIKENNELEPITSNLTQLTFPFQKTINIAIKVITQNKWSHAETIYLRDRSYSKKQNNQPSVSGGGLNNLIRRILASEKKRRRK